MPTFQTPLLGKSDERSVGGIHSHPCSLGPQLTHESGVLIHGQTGRVNPTDTTVSPSLTTSIKVRSSAAISSSESGSPGSLIFVVTPSANTVMFVRTRPLIGLTRQGRPASLSKPSRGSAWEAGKPQGFPTPPVVRQGQH